MKSGYIIFAFNQEALERVRRAKFAVVEILFLGPWVDSDYQLLRSVMQDCPNTLWIIRVLPDHLDPGVDLVGDMLAKTEKIRGYGKVIAHSYNEPAIFTEDDAKRLNEAEVHFAEEMHRAGLKVMGLCLSESHLTKGNQPLWQHLLDAVKAVDFLGFNEYDRPGSTTWANRYATDYRWRIGHWEENLKTIQSLGVEPPPIIIGEGLIDGAADGGPGHIGWRGYQWNPQQYLDEIKAAHRFTYSKPQISGHLLFGYCPGDPSWPTFDVSGEFADLLEGWAREGIEYYKEEPMEDLRPFIPGLQIVVDQLPKHPTKTYTTRPLSEIKHHIWHHAAGYGTPEKIAQYHVEVRDKPGIAYTLYLRRDGTIYQVNWLTTVSWHTGAAEKINNISISNLYGIATCLEGILSGTEAEEITDAQRQAIPKVAKGVNDFLQRTLGYSPHSQWENTQCPGKWAEIKAILGTDYEALYRQTLAENEALKQKLAGAKITFDEGRALMKAGYDAL